MASSLTSISIFSHTNFLLRMMYILDGSGRSSDLNLTSMQFLLSIWKALLWNSANDTAPLATEVRDSEKLLPAVTNIPSYV